MGACISGGAVAAVFDVVNYLSNLAGDFCQHNLSEGEATFCRLVPYHEYNDSGHYNLIPNLRIAQMHLAVAP